jgi:hypothetical protein
MFLAALVAASTAGCSASLLGVSPTRGYRAQVDYARPAAVSAGQVPALDEAGLAIVTLDGHAAGPAGTLEMTLELPGSDRGVQALPDGTDRVVITISSPKLDEPLRQEIRRTQFLNGLAKMIVTKLPLGSTEVAVQVFDASGAQISRGTATATVRADTVSAVKLDLVVKEATGGLAISVDSKPQYADKPEIYLPPDTSAALSGVIGSPDPEPAPKSGKTYSALPHKKMFDTGITVAKGQFVDFRGIAAVTTTRTLYAVIVSGSTTRVINVVIRETTRLQMPIPGKLCLSATKTI